MIVWENRRARAGFFSAQRSELRVTIFCAFFSLSKIWKRLADNFSEGGEEVVERKEPAACLAWCFRISITDFSGGPRCEEWRTVTAILGRSFITAQRAGVGLGPVL